MADDDVKDPEGTSYLPGAAPRRYGQDVVKGNTRRFKSFPRIKKQAALDKARIKREYMESQIVDWYAYCASRSYNPIANSLPFRQWVREKKVRDTWRGIAAELEDEATKIGPKTLLSSIRAVKALPETAAGMLALVQHGIKLHLTDVQQDQMQAHVRGRDLRQSESAFTLDGQGLCFYASALKQTGELLMKSLGIDSAMGLDPERWLRLVEEQMARIEGEEGTEKEESIQVEIIGAGDAREQLKDAIARYMDKPPELPPAVIDAPVADEDPTEEIEAGAEYDVS